jgi:hypothetical protein
LIGIVSPLSFGFQQFAAPCLPGRTTGMTEHVFVETPVLYWSVSLAISGRAIVPDPGPPKPIS